MQVDNVQNNNYNNYNTNFGAKLRLNGYTKGIGRETILSWERKLKDIGTDKDIVTLNFNKPEYKSLRNKKDVIRSMKFSAVAEINGTQYQTKNTVAAQNSRMVFKIMVQKVSDFINRLN